MKFVLELLGLYALIAVAAAFGFLDNLAEIASFVGFWLCPLILSLLNITVFCKVSRASEMPDSFIAGTLIAIVALSAAGIGLLDNQAILYWGLAMTALGFYTVVLSRTSGLGRLAAGFRQSTDMWPGFPGFPTAPNSRFITLPMFEFTGGIALVVLISCTPLSTLHGLWIYVPALLCLNVGLVMQLSHLKAGCALEREKSNRKR